MAEQAPGKPGSKRTTKIGIASLVGAATTALAALWALWLNDPETAAKIAATGTILVTMLNSVAPMFAQRDAVATAVLADKKVVEKAVAADEEQEARMADPAWRETSEVVAKSEGR